jgi:hypothetical protein
VRRWGAADESILVLFAAAVAIVFLTVRFVLLGRVLDMLFVESTAARGRGLTLFLLNAALILFHAIALYAMALLMREGRGALMPWAFMALALANVLWFLALWLFGGLAERGPLRGAWVLLLTSLGVGAAVALGCRALEGLDRASPTNAVLLASCGALLLCGLDAVFQGRIYCRKEREAAASQ